MREERRTKKRKRKSTNRSFKKIIFEDREI
jgi:hypothetical protein